MGIIRWIVVAVLLAWGTAVDAMSAVLDAAAAGERADRGVQVTPDAACDLATVEAVAARHPEVGQLVLMATDTFTDTWGTVEVAVRDGATWRCQTDAMTARYGRSGTRPLVERVSGDGTTPAGVFPLGVVEAWDGQVFSLFGNRSDPGVLAPYREVRDEDCWGATPNSSRYQHLVNRPGCPGPHDEWLPRYGDVYSHAAVIGANLDPISGDDPGETPYAAAIFLHRHSYASDGTPKSTSGCISLAAAELELTLRLLDPRLDPHFAIGPRDWLRDSA